MVFAENFLVNVFDWSFNESHENSLETLKSSADMWTLSFFTCGSTHTTGKHKLSLFTLNLVEEKERGIVGGKLMFSSTCWAFKLFFYRKRI